MGIRIATPLLILALATSMPWPTQAQPASSPPPSQTELPLFAIEIKVGPKWDATKPPQEQAHFQEHSANLRRLRESGSLLLGARYSDKGLIVVAASSVEDARKMMDADPSIAAGTFVFEIHPFSVFYPGTVQGRSGR
jgi:uncharacterized protein YciI